MRLTADLVTGKWDVREAVAKLPEVVEVAGVSAEADVGIEGDEEEGSIE